MWGTSSMLGLLLAPSQYGSHHLWADRFWGSLGSPHCFAPARRSEGLCRYDLVLARSAFVGGQPPASTSVTIKAECGEQSPLLGRPARVLRALSSSHWPALCWGAGTQGRGVWGLAGRAHGGSSKVALHFS